MYIVDLWMIEVRGAFGWSRKHLWSQFRRCLGYSNRASDGSSIDAVSREVW